MVQLVTQCPFQASGEVFTPATDATKFTFPQLQLYSPRPTASLNKTGFVNLAAGQTAWLTVFNAKANPIAPCWLRLSYVNAQRRMLVDANGNPLTFETTLPGPGASATFNLAV